MRIMRIEGGKLQIEGLCKRCKKLWKLVVDEALFERWKGGAMIQEVFPYMPAGDRELLISSICDPCFDAVFTEE